MIAINTSSVYDLPQTQERLRRAKEALVRAGITGIKVRIGCAYAKPLPQIPWDQYWVQRTLLR